MLDIALDAFGSRAEGAAPAEESLRDVVRKVGRNVVRTVGDALGDSAAQRLLINGNAVVSGEHGFAIAEGVDAKRAVHGLADATYRIRRAEKLRGSIASVLVKDFYAASLAHAKTSGGR